jgi:hypothetical protein
METQLGDHLWVGLIIWMALFISDYSFTLACASLYRRGIRDKIAFEGSFELTPYYQKDIDSLKRISPRFLFALMLALLMLSMIWFLSGFIEMRQLYLLALGALVLLQLAVHKRHLQNFFLFRAMLQSDSVRGRIEYSRSLVLQQSSFELLLFAAIFALLALVTRSLFVLGGALGCASTSLKHWRLSQNAMMRQGSSLEMQLVPKDE